MNRIKYEQYHGAAGYDAIARRKIKELEKKLGPQMVEKVLVDEPEAVLPEQFEGLAMNTLPTRYSLISGKTYTVEIDGNKYSCVAQEMDLGGARGVGIGNAALAPVDGGFADTGEPFLALNHSAEGEISIQMVISVPATYDSYPTHTFSIKISTMEEKASDSGNSKPLMFIVTNGQAVLPEGSPSIEEFIKGNLGGAEGSISLIWPQAFVCTEPESLEISICTKVKYESDMSGVNLSFFDRDFTIQIDLSTYRAALVNNKPN